MFSVSILQAVQLYLLERTPRVHPAHPYGNTYPCRHVWTHVS